MRGIEPFPDTRQERSALIREGRALLANAAQLQRVGVKAGTLGNLRESLERIAWGGWSEENRQLVYAAARALQAEMDELRKEIT